MFGSYELCFLIRTSSFGFNFFVPGRCCWASYPQHLRHFLPIWKHVTRGGDKSRGKRVQSRPHLRKHTQCAMARKMPGYTKGPSRPVGGAAVTMERNGEKGWIKQMPLPRRHRPRRWWKPKNAGGPKTKKKKKAHKNAGGKPCNGTRIQTTLGPIRHARLRLPSLLLPCCGLCLVLVLSSPSCVHRWVRNECVLLM